MMDKEIELLRTRLEGQSKFILKVLAFGLWVTSIIMFTVMLAGLLKVCYGVVLEFNFMRHDTEGLTKLLEGLELIFVSPLCYLLLQSITKYISATRPEINPSIERKQEYVLHAIFEITNVKVLTLGLFISLLFLHSIKLILQEAITFKSLICIVVILFALGSYYYMLDSLAEKLRKKAGE